MESENMTSDPSQEEEEVILVEGEISEEEAQRLLEEMEAMEKQAEEERKRVLEDLAFSVEKKFEARKRNRNSKEAEWTECMRLWLGALSSNGKGRNPSNPFDTGVAATRPDRNIVQIKCDITVAQQIEMQFAGGDKNWDINPPAYTPDMDPNMAAGAAMQMEKAIQSQLTKTKYGFKSRSAMWNRVVLGTGVLKGPVNSGRLKTVYRPDEVSGEYIPELTTEYVPEIENVNPWLFYPDDTTNDACAIEDAIEVHPMSVSELAKLRKNPGFQADQIEEALEKKPSDLHDPSFSDFSKITDTNQNLLKNKYLVLEYHGPVTKTQLEALSVDPSYDTPSEEYYGEVWVVDGKIIRLELSNIEGVYETPYSVCPWKQDPSSVFGIGLPLILRDHQRVTTETWHMILDNSSISSGPQVILQKNSIVPADGVWEFNPRKVWLAEYGQSIQEAFHFFVPPNVSEQLLGVMNTAAAFAEEESGVSMMSAGLGSAEISESATGQAILNQNSSLLGDSFAENWDDYITEKVIRRFYAWNMQYNPDPSIKGTFDIDVRSSTEYKNKLMVLRDIERLSMEAAQNPELALYLDLGAATKARLSMMNLPNEKMVRSDEEVEQARQAQAEAQQSQIDPNVLEMEKINVEKEKIQLQREQLEFERTMQQQREMMDHDEKMSSNYARIAEAEAQAVRTQNEKEIELIRLGAKQELTYAQLQKDLGIATMNDSTKKFLAGLEASRKNRAQLLDEKEYSYALREGKGF